MVLRLINIVLLPAIFLTLLSLPAFSCSYADGYLPPTEYDLVKKADAILLAQPISKSGYDVDFKVIEVLKGNYRGNEFHGSEMHTSCEDYSYSIEVKRYLEPLLAQKVPKVHPRYLLFLNKTKNEWAIWSIAAGQMNEMIIEVDSSTFLKTVKHFVRISSLNNYEREKSELKRLRLLARSNSKEYPKELIGSIDDHLSSPTPSKSYQDLLSLYAHSSPERQRQVLWAFAWGKHAEAAPFMIKLIEKAVPSDYIAPLSEFVTQTKDQTLLDRLGKNYPDLDRRVRWPVMWALIKTSNRDQMDMMLAALRSADKEEAGRLAEWFVRFPADEAKEIVRSLVGTEYQQNWELSLGLAGMGDAGTLEWARAFMQSSDKDRWMAYYIIALSPLIEADKLARGVIEGNDGERLTWLIQGYRESHNPNRWDRLRDIVRLENLDQKAAYWLRITMENMAAEGDANSAELLKLLNR